MLAFVPKQWSKTDVLYNLGKAGHEGLSLRAEACATTRMVTHMASLRDRAALFRRDRSR